MFYFLLEYNCLYNVVLVGAVHCRSVAKSCPTLCDPLHRCMIAALSFTISQSLPKFMFIELVMLANHLILCHPLLLLPSIFPSIRVFSNESVLHIWWPKCQSFNFSISPSNEYSGWFPLGLTGLISLQSKGLPRVFSNTNSSKASTLWH